MLSEKHLATLPQLTNFSKQITSLSKKKWNEHNYIQTTASWMTLYHLHQFHTAIRDLYND